MKKDEDQEGKDEERSSVSITGNQLHIKAETALK